VKFLLDHNLAPNLARALALLVDPSDHVTCPSDLGWQALEDEEWIPRLDLLTRYEELRQSGSPAPSP